MDECARCQRQGYIDALSGWCQECLWGDPIIYRHRKEHVVEREIIDQLGSAGTYVTRDCDGVLRHWNGITDEYVGSDPDRPT